MAFVYFFGFVAVLGGLIYGAILLYEHWLRRRSIAGCEDLATSMVDGDDQEDASTLLSPGLQHSSSRGVSVSSNYHINV